ncbi:MAG: hypothetical protein NTZ35_06165 [Ignavibacteriales bacterium]|nr:hypothetical protein [Ignavibacteriales bacterium]
MRLNKLCSLSMVIVLGSITVLGQSKLKIEMITRTASTPVASTSLAMEPQGDTPKKSIVLAIAYSLVLPGLGDLYAENFRTGKYFMGADAGLWLTYGGIRVYGQWLKDDAKTLAVQHASANFDGKDAKFEVNLGNFADVLSYNDAKLRNREFDVLYDPKSNFAWQWSSDADRLHYKDLRNRGEGTLKNSQFVLGALFLNRVIAAISAVRSVSVYNRSAQMLGSWQLNARVTGGMLAADGLELNFSREF